MKKLLNWIIYFFGVDHPYTTTCSIHDDEYNEAMEKVTVVHKKTINDLSKK